MLEGITGSQDVYTPRNDGAQYLNLTVDRLEAGRLGVDADALAAVLRAQVEGLRVGTVYREGKRLPLVVRGPEALAHLAVALQRPATGTAGRALGAARQSGADGTHRRPGGALA